MNTPAHAVLNLWALGRRERPETALPIVMGAVLPDLPMLVFYGWAKLGAGLPEREIWTRAYFDPRWQAVFDLFHSLPLILLGLLAALRWGGPRLAGFFGGMILHIPEDFLFHHDDAHRHFYPLWNWRFRSPISYWDPRYCGHIVAPLEILAVLAGCIVLLRRYESRAARLLIAAVMAIYGLYLGYVMWAWV